MSSCLTLAAQARTTHTLELSADPSRTLLASTCDQMAAMPGGVPNYSFEPHRVRRLIMRVRRWPAIASAVSRLPAP